MEKLTLTPNVPQQIALKFPDGKLVEGRYGDQVMYSLTNGQVMYLDTDVAAKINLLELRKNEPFMICKRWTGKKGDSPQLDIWRPDAASVATGHRALGDRRRDRHPAAADPAHARGAHVGRVVSPTARAGVSQHPPRQRRLCNRRPTTTAMVTNRSTGMGRPRTHPGPTSAAGIPTPPVKVGYDVALRRILRVTIAELRPPANSGVMPRARTW